MQGLRVLDRWRLHYDPMLLRTQRLANRIVVTSSAARGLLPERYQDKSVVIPEGIDEGDFVADDVPAGNYIMASGRLIPYKAFDLLIKAFVQTLAQHEAALWITGDGPDRSYLASLIDHYGAGARIRLLGRVDRQQNLRLMKGSLFCVFPALKEAFGGVNLEAMAAGKPVIVTDWGGPSDLVENGVNGFKIPPTGEQEFIGALRDRILELLRDESQRSRMGVRAVEVARAHLWPALAERYRRLYADVLGG